jgi:hypothetical protein
MSRYIESLRRDDLSPVTLHTGDCEEVINKASSLSLLRVPPLFRRHITPNATYFHSPRHRTSAFEPALV